MANKFKGLKCPKCGKKGLSYAPHPHAYGWKNYDKVACRYCEARFPASQIEAHLTKHAPDVVESAASSEILPASEVSASEADSNTATTQVM